MLSRVEHSRLQTEATHRAAQLNLLLTLHELGVLTAQRRSVEGPVLLRVGVPVTGPARGGERVGLVAEATHSFVVMDYLTNNVLACAAAETGRCAPPGTNSATYATEAAIRARMEAEKKLMIWRRWVTTDPRLLESDDTAREVWRRIAPALVVEPEPAVRAQLARREATENLERHLRCSWPQEVYERAYAEAYIRDRVSRICRLAPHLAWVRVRRARVARNKIRVVE